MASNRAGVQFVTIKLKPGWTGRCAAGLLALVLLLLALCAVLPVPAQFGKIKDFIQLERYNLPFDGGVRTNRLRWMLSGALAEYVTNNLVRVDHMRLEHYQLDGRTNLQTIAPECFFNTRSQVASSTGRLEVIGFGGALRIEGNTGFTIHITNSTLTVSNRVRTVLHQGPSQP